VRPGYAARLRHCRQAQRDKGPTAWQVFGMNHTAVIGHDALYDRQSQSRTPGLVGHIGFEYLTEEFRIESWTVIAHGDLHELASLFLAAATTHHDAPLITCRLDGIL
jgi:hypothetical protein